LDRFDATLARGLSYYTGAIMEINVPDLAGSLGGGGRYDDLVGMFLGQSIPAAAFSLGLERILVVMGERGRFPASLATTMMTRRTVRRPRPWVVIRIWVRTARSGASRRGSCATTRSRKSSVAARSCWSRW